MQLVAAILLAFLPILPISSVLVPLMAKLLHLRSLTIFGFFTEGDRLSPILLFCGMMSLSPPSLISPFASVSLLWSLSQDPLLISRELSHSHTLVFPSPRNPCALEILGRQPIAVPVWTHQV